MDTLRWTAVLSTLVIAFSLYGCAGGQTVPLQAELTRTQDMIRTNRSESHAEYEEIKTELTGLHSRIDHLAKVHTDLIISLDEYKMLLRSLATTLTDLESKIQKSSSSRYSTQSSRPTQESMVDADQRPEQVYQTAYNDYINRKYDLAIIEFQGFLTSFPDSDLADNSQYWIGECYYSQGKHEQAIQEFDKVIQNFPDGDKKIASHLKKGLSYQEQGDIVSAKEILEDLINRFPFSEEARIAEDRIKNMN